MKRPPGIASILKKAAPELKNFVLALQKERASQRIYRALAQREKNEARRNALIGLAETEHRHAQRKWFARIYAFSGSIIACSGDCEKK